MNFVLLMVISISINLIVSLAILQHLVKSNIEPFEYSARNLYENSNMNMFGCIVCSGIFMFFTSFYHIPAFVCWIVYKLFHVGRRK